MVVPDRLMDKVLRLRFETDLWANTVNQAVLAEFITEGHLGRHIRRMRETYAQRLAALHHSAKMHLGDALQLSGIQAGLTTAAFYKAPIDSIDFERMAARSGIDTSGLDRYTLRKQKINGILLGFAAFEPRVIDQGMQTLASILQSIDRNPFDGQPSLSRFRQSGT
jgi:GntR family transcriptional regulator/MocR family aminotransferase